MLAEVADNVVAGRLDGEGDDADDRLGLDSCAGAENIEAGDEHEHEGADGDVALDGRLTLGEVRQVGVDFVVRATVVDAVGRVGRPERQQRQQERQGDARPLDGPHRATERVTENRDCRDSGRHCRRKRENGTCERVFHVDFSEHSSNRPRERPYSRRSVGSPRNGRFQGFWRFRGFR